MFQHNLAYRHENGEVEGFQGVGFDKAAAEKDALSQIRKKLEAIRPFNKPAQLDEARVIRDEKSLTPAELDQVRKDWNSNVRY